MIDGRALGVVVLIVAVLVVWSILRSPTYAQVEEMLLEDRVEQLAATRYSSHRWEANARLPHVDLPLWGDLRPRERDVWRAAARADVKAADR